MLPANSLPVKIATTILHHSKVLLNVPQLKLHCFNTKRLIRQVLMSKILYDNTSMENYGMCRHFDR